MAFQRLLASWTVLDAKGRKASMPFYGMFDDTTVTLAEILAWMDSVSVLIDAITEAKIVSQSVSVYPALGAGLKANPVANCDVQETGLFTFPLASLPAKSFSIDVPAFLQSAFVGENINTANTNVAAFLDEIVAHGGDIGIMNDVWSSGLLTQSKARKTFRKLGGR